MEKTLIYDMCTIFPPTNKPYISPWEIRNVEDIIEGFRYNIDGLFCRNIDGIPCIIDQELRMILFQIGEYGEIRMPIELKHIKLEEPKLPERTIVQKILGKPFKFENKDDFLEYIGKENHFNFVRRQVEATKNLLFNFNNPYTIHFLCNDFTIIERLENRKDFGVTYGKTEGLLRLEYDYEKRICNNDESSFIGGIKPEFETLYILAMEKLKKFSPNRIGEFFSYHFFQTRWTAYDFIELSDRMANELYFSYTETTVNLAYRKAFIVWINEIVKSKKIGLEIDRFNDSVKSKLIDINITPKQKISIKPNTSATVEDRNRDRKLSMREIALIYWYDRDNLIFSKSTAKQIAELYGHTSKSSGLSLYKDHYLPVSKDEKQRTHNDTSVQYLNNIIPTLTTDRGKREANEDLKKAHEFKEQKRKRLF